MPEFKAIEAYKKLMEESGGGRTVGLEQRCLPCAAACTQFENSVNFVRKSLSRFLAKPSYSSYRQQSWSQMYLAWLSPPNFAQSVDYSGALERHVDLFVKPNPLPFVGESSPDRQIGGRDNGSINL